ncbi:MAG: TatD family hydrolase [Peptococcia bacterium]
MYFDTHAHLDDRKYREDQDLVISRAKEAGLELIVNVGYNIASARRTVELTKKYDLIYGTVGMHPHDAKDLDGDGLRELKRLAQEPKIVAIGEIGLDYHYDHSPRDVQQRVFRRMIGLAQEVKLPIVIHDREAHEDVFRILREEKAEEVGGIFHCYSGSWPLAKEAIEMGFYISIAGPITFHNAKKTVEVVKEVPLEWLLIETDSPYLAPVPYRGKRNEPAHVVKVAEMIAQIKGLEVEEVGRVTTANGKRAYGIS